VKLPLRLTQDARPFDVVVIGENSVDLVGVVSAHPSANSKVELAEYLELPGGEGATAAVGLARLGWKTRYIGRFGDDRLGELSRHQLRAEGVNLDNCIVVRNQTNRLAMILVDQKTGSRTVLWRRGQQLFMKPEDISDDAVASARVMLVGSDDVETMADAVRRARAHGVATVGDLERIHPQTPSLLQQLDVVIMAAGFPTALTGAATLSTALREVAESSRAALVCVTLGEEGCLARVGAHELHVRGFAIDAVDTTGAGDLFRAGFIARWLGNPVHPDVGDMLRYANAVAALNCRAVGAQTAAPRPAEVEALLST
jgi:sulfofructose kinase